MYRPYVTPKQTAIIGAIAAGLCLLCWVFLWAQRFSDTLPFADASFAFHILHPVRFVIVTTLMWVSGVVACGAAVITLIRRFR